MTRRRKTRLAGALVSAIRRLKRAKPEENAAPSIPSCPKCAKPMVKRFAEAEQSGGKPFWGCSGYPHCYGTRSVS